MKDGDNDDCRYAVYDYDYVQEAEGTEASYRSKLFLMSWCPDSAKIKKKMIYSSSFDTLKKAFVGVHKVRCSRDGIGLVGARTESKLRLSGPLPFAIGFGIRWKFCPPVNLRGHINWLKSVFD